MNSFISGTLLKEEPCCKFMLKYDINVFSKNKVKFWHTIAGKVSAFAFHYIWQLWLIACKNYSKLYTRKYKNNIMCITIIMTYQWLTSIPIWHCWG